MIEKPVKIVEVVLIALPLLEEFLRKASKDDLDAFTETLEHRVGDYSFPIGLGGDDRMNHFLLARKRGDIAGRQERGDVIVHELVDKRLAPGDRADDCE
jgi:hypothetical protein